MRRPDAGLLAPQNRAVSLAVMASLALAFCNSTSVTAAHDWDSAHSVYAALTCNLR